VSGVMVDSASGVEVTTLGVDAANLVQSSTASAFSTVGATCQCTFAVVGATMTVRSDGAGTLGSVEAVLRVANLTGLPCNAAEAATMEATLGGLPTVPLSVTTSFALTATAQAAVTTSLAAGNVVARSRAGNPGYVEGSVVRGGTLASDPTVGSSKTAVASFVDGLAVIGPRPDGTCASTTASDGRHVPVWFGQDMSVGCSMELTPGELETFCNAQAGGNAPAFLSLAGGATHVGMFGNADPLQTTQWLTISASAASAAPVWDASTLTCQGAIVGLNLQLLHAPVGEVNNPQRKIIAAASSFLTADLRVGSTLGTGKGVYPLAVYVSFTGLGSGTLDRFIPPPPPVLELPHDLFYPFQINDIAIAGASHASASIPLIAALCLCLWVLQ
jgi:hypothetical protein